MDENNFEINYLSQFKMSKQIEEYMGIKNLEYSINGEFFSYTTEDSLKIYYAATGLLKNIVTVEMGTMKYFQRNTILHTNGNSIMYLSVYDNKYLRKFDGHPDQINEISVSPQDDLFMSIGASNINIWDIRYKNPIKSIASNGKLGAMSQDYEYALADNNFLYLFDRRNDNGPMKITHIKPNFYKSLSYTTDNSCIILSSKKDHVFVNSEGELISNCMAETDSTGDNLGDSNIYIYTSSNFIFAFKILEKKRIGHIETENTNYLALKTNPGHSQFIYNSEYSLNVFNYIPSPSP